MPTMFSSIHLQRFAPIDSSTYRPLAAREQSSERDEPGAAEPPELSRLLVFSQLQATAADDRQSQGDGTFKKTKATAVQTRIGT